MPSEHDLSSLKEFAGRRESENEELKDKLREYEAMLFEMRAHLAVYERMNKLRAAASSGGYWARIKYQIATRLLLEK